MKPTERKPIFPKLFLNECKGEALELSQKLSKFGHQNEKYIDRFLYDSRMKNIWREIDKLVPTQLSQSTLFWAALEAMDEWPKLDYRSTSDKKNAINRMVETAKRLDKLIANTYESERINRYYHARTKARSWEAKNADDASTIKLEIKPDPELSVHVLSYRPPHPLDDLLKNLASLIEMGSEILSGEEDKFPAHLKLKTPALSHKNKSSAFSNFLFDKLYRYWRMLSAGLDRKVFNSLDPKIINNISEVVFIISDQSMSADQSRKRADRFQWHAAQKRKKLPQTNPLPKRTKSTK